MDAEAYLFVIRSGAARADGSYLSLGFATVAAVFGFGPGLF